MIASAGVVAAALAGADQNAGVAPGRGLANLNVDLLVMQGYFAADGDACLVVPQVERVRRQGGVAPSITKGATIRSWRSPATNVIVFQ
jgi:hypothetical protein